MRFEHMLARPGQDIEALGSDPDITFEEKVDGVRVFLSWDGQQLRLHTRHGRDVTAQFPELTCQRPAVGPFVLDAELTLFGQWDRTAGSVPLTLRHVLRRLNSAPPPPARFIRLPYRAQLSAFDCVLENGVDLTAVPLVGRREALSRMDRDLKWVSRIEVYDAGAAAMAAMRLAGREGLIAKRLSSPYRQGKRSSDWLKFKHLYSLVLIAFGYEPSTSPVRPLGSLRLAALDVDGKAHPVGSVGSGLSAVELQQMRTLLDGGQFPMVAVTCMGRTQGGLREPVFLARVMASSYELAHLGQLDGLPVF